MDIRQLLEIPLLYQFLQTLTGLNAARRQYVCDFLRPTPGMTVLDIGCGPASMLSYLPNSVHYVGYDANPRYIEYARRHYVGHGKFYHASIGGEKDIDDVNKNFDLVMAVGVLHHIDDTLAHLMIDDAWERLKSGGALVTLDPVLIPNQARLAHFMVMYDRGQYVRTSEGYINLVARRFTQIEQYTGNLLRIPHTQFIMRAVKHS
jgi:SAM-dependent methyltransferase